MCLDDCCCYIFFRPMPVSVTAGNYWECLFLQKLLTPILIFPGPVTHLLNVLNRFTVISPKQRNICHSIIKILVQRNCLRSIAEWLSQTTTGCLETSTGNEYPAAL